MTPGIAVASTAVYIEVNLRATEVVSVSATTNYTLQARKADSIGTGAGSLFNGGTEEQSIFKAIRIG